MCTLKKMDRSEHIIIGNFTAWPFEPDSYTPPPLTTPIRTGWEGPDPPRLQWAGSPMAQLQACLMSEEPRIHRSLQTPEKEWKTK